VSETLPLRDAASRLGVSERTLRRRIKAGQLVGRQVATPQGYRWLVDIGDVALVPASQSKEWRQVVEERDAYRDVIAELLVEMSTIRALLEKSLATRQAVNPAPAGQPEKRMSWWRRLARVFTVSAP
jgi:transposase